MMTATELAEKATCIRHTYRLTPEVYYAFQRCSNDFNPLHVDAAFAEERGFPGCVMYGNILNAFISHYVGMLLPSREVMIQEQSISFHRPVYLHDELVLEAKVDTVSEAVNVVAFKLQFRRVATEGKGELVAKGRVQVGLLNRR